MCDKNLILVKTIEKYPCLYKTQSADYLKRDETCKAWKEVAKEAKLTASECREKWKNLRYSFLRSLKPSLDGSLKKKYYLNDEMQFILPYIRVFSSKPNEIVSHYVDSDTDVENDDNFNKKSPIHYSKINDTHHTTESPSKKAKYCESCSSNNQQTMYIPDKQDVDSRRMFLLSLLPEVVELTGQQMSRFRRKILELLDDISGNKNDDNILFWTQENANQIDLVKNEIL